VLICMLSIRSDFGLVWIILTAAVCRV
jgi:hypothetical protein